MARVYLRDLKTGKTFYQVVIGVSASGLKTASAVKSVQCFSVARRTPADRQVQGETPTWEVRMKMGEAPARFVEAYGLGVLGSSDMPSWPGQPGLVLGPALFTTRGAANRFRKAFLSVHQPEQAQLDEVRLEHIWNQAEAAHDEDVFGEQIADHAPRQSTIQPPAFTDLTYVQSTPVMPVERPGVVRALPQRALQNSFLRVH